MSGREVSLDLFSGKVVLLHYWATWCGPCIEELPEVKRLFDAYHAKGLEIVSISLDEQAASERLSYRIKRNAMNWAQVCDGKGFQSPLVQVYKISAIPFCAVIGRDGKICAMNKQGDQLDKAIRDALGK